jgi:hypothetical protein
MSERYGSPYDGIAHKWLALIERRQQNIIELCYTGRWRHYYTQAQFLDEMGKVLDLRKRWALLAGLPAIEQSDGRETLKKTKADSGDRAIELLPRRAAVSRRPSLAVLAAVQAPL